MSYTPALSAEAQQLFAEYYAQIKDFSPDFADDLFREALRCYSIEAFTAVCITCRAAVEESLKEVYEILLNLRHASTQWPVESMKLESLKQWAYEQEIISRTQFEALGEIQRRGNRSAHGPTADIARQWRGRQEKKERLTEPLEIWADKSDALSQLRSTSVVLHDLKLKRADLQSKGLSLVKPYRDKIPIEDYRLLIQLYNGDAQFNATVFVAAVFAHFSILTLVQGKGAHLFSFGLGSGALWVFVAIYFSIAFIGMYFIIQFLEALGIVHGLGRKSTDPVLKRLYQLDIRLRDAKDEPTRAERLSENKELIAVIYFGISISMLASALCLPII